MNQDIENIIKNLPKYKNGSKAIPKDDIVVQYSELSLIADEVLKVVVETLKKELEQKRLEYIPNPNDMESMVKASHNMLLNDILELLDNLSPNKENKNNG